VRGVGSSNLPVPTNLHQLKVPRSHPSQKARSMEQPSTLDFHWPTLCQNPSNQEWPVRNQTNVIGAGLCVMPRTDFAPNCH